MRQRGWRLGLKRSIDVVVAALGLLCLSPVLVASGLAVRRSIGRPVIFRQTRAGRGGQPFSLVKLRTMTDERDETGELLPDDQRLTGLGRFLRSLSLDEIPQLWNVLRGEVSLVGPRPLFCDYLELYSPEEARRQQVLPGITGWAQVNGRNALSWEERFALDVWYVDNWSLMLDLRILARTVALVLRRAGISQEGHPTMPRFEGYERRD
jgi:lipopolysaccharide/colanic/teichoic acid biosynthesis glycosyltransferase